ncbi:MAG: type II secretion system F family protein [Tepidisphaeraceae bacterium]
MNPWIIPILTFLAVIFVGGAVIAVMGGRRRALEARLFGAGAGQGSQFAPMGQVSGTRLVNTLENVGRAVSSSSDAPSSADLREKLTHAGFYDPAAPMIFMGAQLLLFVIALPVAGLLALALRLPMIVGICVVLVVTTVLAIMPNLFVRYRRDRRRQEVREQLPDAIDLLEICVTSGMGLEMAWNAVADDFRGVSTTLADEMSLATLEMHLGAPRAQALRNMARRTGVDDIASLVATLVQSERFGTSVSQALRTYADALRTERSQRAEEQAEKLAVKLLFPMVLFIFPVVFIVILGPAVIKIHAMFSNG